MTIKEKLKQYRTLKLELDEVNDEINEKSVKGSVQGSMKDHPYILQNHTIGGVTEEDYSLLERKSEIKAKIKSVDDFVNGIDDYKIRKAIMIYYMDPLDESCEKPTWESIANKFSDGSTGDSIRISVQRYLKKFS